MKRLNLTKVIASALIVASALALNPIGASAEWRQDSTGWWYAESNSWATGWRSIDGKWYCFDSNGYMLHDTTVGGYKLGSNGAWIAATPTTSNNSSGISYWDDDIKYINFQGDSSFGGYFECAGPNSNKTVEDNLGNKYSNFLTLRLFKAFEDSSCYIEFPLNGQFKQFKSKLGLTKEYQNNLSKGTVKIYLDDVKIYDTTLKSGDLLQDVNIDLTGKNKIKFYYCADKSNKQCSDSQIGFFDGQFIK